MRALKNVQFCSRSRKAKILTTGIYGIFRGLKFESDAEIGQKGMFFKALSMLQEYIAWFGKKGGNPLEIKITVK